jgi:beta-lactamase class A
MQSDRREFLTRAGIGAAGAALCGRQVSAHPATIENRAADWDCASLKQEILELFSNLPDRKALKIWAPATRSGSEILIELNANMRMFVASTMKAIILCERLRHLDSQNRDVAEWIADNQLALNESVWSPGSPIFNPPDLSGKVSERTAMEAMVVHSDNTATDMVLKEDGAEAVRNFIHSIGLKNSMIPDSTRAFAGYLLGAPNYKTITWEELISIPAGPLAHPFLNDVETLASSPDDLVSFFSRALQGDFFSPRKNTLFEFRRILLLGDINSLVPFPLGLSVFGKAGYADIAGSHARSIAGAVYFPNRWIYFSAVLNWDAEQAADPETVDAFYRAIHKSIVLLQQNLSS